MRKKVFGRQLKRSKKTRGALFVGLVASLVKYDKITTTEAKAKAVLPDIDHLINLAKTRSTASTRRLYALMRNDKAPVKKLIEEVAPKLMDRESGYVKIIKLGPRRGDSAPMVRLEWVVDVSKQPKAKTKSPAKRDQILPDKPKKERQGIKPEKVKKKL
ncbi:50S ribosomal protein L17 [Candidatus Woesebacteria bacterium GWB1_43_5]|uniref:50S ribosomal protein L17 n=1 Tax=Candidatus Woesebacteria bacterium GWB1_43_5 TaxID=1802474 RepID=A0A1F7WUM5_9BACT|nr:MAG: 50S ribosomal protein L17 [Candidatus Woesebacteria bacterium GWB1_43_5]